MGNREAYQEAPGVNRTPENSPLGASLSLGWEEMRPGTQVYATCSRLQKHPSARTAFSHFLNLNLGGAPVILEG